MIGLTLVTLVAIFAAAKFSHGDADGTTDLAGALRAAAVQLARSNASRKITILLSDCRATVEGDAAAAAAALSELVIVAPEQDSDEAVRFANDTGARIATVTGPSRVVDALALVLER